MRSDKSYRPGDRIEWCDDDGEEPVDRTGTVLCSLSMQYLVVDNKGIERFVFKSNKSLKENKS